MDRDREKDLKFLQQHLIGLLADRFLVTYALDLVEMGIKDFTIHDTMTRMQSTVLFHNFWLNPEKFVSQWLEVFDLAPVVGKRKSLWFGRFFIYYENMFGQRTVGIDYIRNSGTAEQRISPLFKLGRTPVGRLYAPQQLDEALFM